MNLRALASIVALTLLGACGPAPNTPDSNTNNCGGSMPGGARAAPIPCATPLAIPGGCRNELLPAVCIGGTYRCSAGTIQRTLCRCFDNECEAGVDGGDASMDDSAAPVDSAALEDGAMDASNAD